MLNHDIIGIPFEIKWVAIPATEHFPVHLLPASTIPEIIQKMYSRSLNHIRRAPVFLNPRSLNVSKLHSASSTPLRAGLSSHLRNGSRLLVPLQSQNFIIQVRGEASSVAGRPGSQTPAHAAQNIKEEVGHAASDFAKTIAGANFAVDDVKPVNETFVSQRLGILMIIIKVLKSCFDPSSVSPVPSPARCQSLSWFLVSQVRKSIEFMKMFRPLTRSVTFLLNIGGLPYIAASATTVYLARQAGIAAAGESEFVRLVASITYHNTGIRFPNKCLKFYDDFLPNL